MKLCINCKHVYDAGRLGSEKCAAPQNLQPTNPVHGNNDARWTFCNLHREDNIFWAYALKTCGKRGRWYEPK